MLMVCKWQASARCQHEGGGGQVNGKAEAETVTETVTVTVTVTVTKASQPSLRKKNTERHFFLITPFIALVWFFISIKEKNINHQRRTERNGYTTKLPQV